MIRSFASFALCLFTACAVDNAVETSSESQDLTASEIDSSWFTDSGFTNQVGETDLYCSGGKYQSGTVNTRYVARFTWPCNGAGGETVTCLQYVAPSMTGESGSYQQVPCPAGLF